MSPAFTKDTKSLAPEILGTIVGLLASSSAIYLGYLLTTEPVIKLSDYIQILVLLVIFCALGVSVHVQRQKEKLDESEIYLNRSIDLINKAYDTLCDENGRLINDRVSWVTAARLITRAETLSEKIVLVSHITVFESEHDFQRHRFGYLLKLDSKELPPEFFLGNGYEPGSVGDSAYRTIGQSGVYWLPPQVVSVIYRFRTFPDSYKDPLESSEKLTKREKDQLWAFNDRGLYDYMLFRDYFTCIASKVYQIKDVDKPTEVSASEIDRQMQRISGRESD